MTDVVQRTRAFIARYISDPVDVTDDLFASGMANSLFALQLLDFVEREFGIVVENEDMELDNFRSIGAIAAFVARRQSQAGVRLPLDRPGARA